MIGALQKNILLHSEKRKTISFFIDFSSKAIQFHKQIIIIEKILLKMPKFRWLEPPYRKYK